MTTRVAGDGKGVWVKKFAGGKTGSSKILGRLVVINFAGRVTRGLLLNGCRTILASRTTVLTGRGRKNIIDL